jgi:hypothetical protein
MAGQPGILQIMSGRENRGTSIAVKSKRFSSLEPLELTLTEKEGPARSERCSPPQPIPSSGYKLPAANPGPLLSGNALLTF